MYKILRRPLAAGFSPSDVSGLSIWLKADNGTGGVSDGDAIGTWTDQSGNAINFTQSTSSKKPLYKTNIQNSLPVGRFDGSDDLIQTSTFTTINQPYTIFIAMNFSSGQYMMDAQSNQVNFTKFISGLDYLRFNAGLTNNQYTETYPTGFHVWTILANGSSSLVRKDGSQKVAGDSGSNTLSQLFIGSAFNATSSAALDLGEFILYSGDKTSSFSSVESYLKTRWGTP